jgi:hypothetical protein
MEDEKITFEEYNRNLNIKFFDFHRDYGKWYQFKETFPLITEKQTFIEVLCDDGNPTFHSIWLNDDGTIRIRDYDFHRELLMWKLDECMDLYWRYVPDPPGNCGYSVG